jgi:diguanylate cyclase (GGDEF)-like protein
MFGFSKKPTPTPVVSREQPVGAKSTAASAEASLTALASLVRVYGAQAFDTDDRSAAALASMCERWAAHLLDGSAPPDGGGDGPSGLRRFFERQRSDEVHYVDVALGDLRAVVGAFVQGLKRIAAFDGAADGQAMQRLDRLREIATSGSTDDLRREALSTVDHLASSIQERRVRHRGELASLGERIDALGEALDEAKKRGERDPLTELPNRGALDAQLERSTTLATIFGRPSVLLLLDIDHFKQVNDTHGHPVGDVVLKALAACLTRAFLRRDDLVARYGGEEFAIVVQGAHERDAMKLAERLLAAVHALAVPAGETIVRPTVSVGVAPVVPGETVAAWLERADRALYVAKNTGRDRAALAEAAAPGTTARAAQVSAKAAPAGATATGVSSTPGRRP